MLDDMKVSCVLSDRHTATSRVAKVIGGIVAVLPSSGSFLSSEQAGDGGTRTSKRACQARELCIYGPDVSDSSDTHFGSSIVVGGIPLPGCQYEPSPDTECRLGKVPCSNEGFTCGGWVSVRMRVFAPQTHQNLSSRPFCAPQDPHCRVRGFPHCAQNFFPRGSRLCISNSASFASAGRQMAMRGSWSGTVCEVPTISPPLPWFCRYGNCITPSA